MPSLASKLTSRVRIRDWMERMDGHGGGWVVGDSVDDGATSTSARITPDATWTWSRPPRPPHVGGAGAGAGARTTHPKPTDGTAVGWGLAKLVRAPNVRHLDRCPRPVCCCCHLSLSSRPPPLNETNTSQRRRMP